MAAITAERLAELHALYDQVKARCGEIDDKYSLTPGEPTLNMPETLGLTPLVYTPKSEEELRAVAAQSVAATYLSKQSSAERTYSNTLAAISRKKTTVTNNGNDKMADALADCNAEKEQIMRKVVDNGLYFSTVANRYLGYANDRYNDKLKDIANDIKNSFADLDQQQSDAKELYDATCAAIEQQRQAAEDSAYQKLLQQEEKQRISIEKYNTGLTEKEQKYQASRAKAYDSALRAEQNRVLQNAKIYAEVGETGYRDLICKEKYLVCTEMFRPLARNEANVMTTFDSFLSSALGTYYSTFLSWINTELT